MNRLGWFGNPVGIWETGRRMPFEVLRPVTVRPNEKTSPSLLERDRNRGRVRAANDPRQFRSDFNLIPPKRLVAPRHFAAIEFGKFSHTLGRVMWTRLLKRLVLALLSRLAALHTHPPGVRLRQQTALLVVVAHQRQLLEHAAGKLARHFD